MDLDFIHQEIAKKITEKEEAWAESRRYVRFFLRENSVSMAAQLYPFQEKRL